MRAAPSFLLAACCLLLTGCALEEAARGETAGNDPWSLCSAKFASCAPPSTLRRSTELEALDVRKLVHAASRLDLDKLSASAATRLRKLAMDGDRPLLLEMEAAIDDVEALYAPCRCDGVQSALEKLGIRQLVASRVPPRELRVPETWANRLAGQLSNLRELTMRSATQAIAEATDAARASTEARRHEVERELCETVHEARSMLTDESFERMIELARARREAEAGGGSAHAAVSTLREYARSSSCGEKLQASQP